MKKKTRQFVLGFIYLLIGAICADINIEKYF